MPKASASLLDKARRQQMPDSDMRDCWDLVLRGVELGWLDEQDIGTLIGYLKRRGDFTTEELIFAHSGDRLRVAFLSEEATCKPETMVAELSRLAPAA